MRAAISKILFKVLKDEFNLDEGSEGFGVFEEDISAIGFKYNNKNLCAEIYTQNLTEVIIYDYDTKEIIKKVTV